MVEELHVLRKREDLFERDCSATVEGIIVFHRVIEGHAPMSVIAASEELERVIAVEACRILDQIVKIKESGSRVHLDKPNPFRF
jgi:hypothetical protein